MNREQEIEKLKSEIDKAVRDNKRGHALSLSGRLRGLAMRQKESISVPLGDFEASLKVVNASHQDLLRAVSEGDEKGIEDNVRRIKRHLWLAQISLNYMGVDLD